MRKRQEQILSGCGPRRYCNEMSDGSYELVSGNEVGVLFFDLFAQDASKKELCRRIGSGEIYCIYPLADAVAATMEWNFATYFYWF